MGIVQHREPGWITEPDILEAVLRRNGFTDISVKMDSMIFAILMRWTFGRRHAVRACAVVLIDLMPRKNSGLSRYLLNA
jgi:hypothetical protein